MNDETERNEHEKFGLKSFYLPAINWAKTENTKYALKALIHLGLIEDRPNCLGTFLQFISTSQSHELLELWPESEDSAEILRIISDAVQLDPSILNIYPPLPQSSASQQLHGNLGTLYLLAMIIEAPTEEIIWLNKLKLWLLVHAMNRTQFSNYKDKYIYELSRKMRQASAQQYKYKETQKHELLISGFREIKKNENEFDNLNRWLSYKSKLVQNSPHINQTIKVLFQHIIEVAQYNDQPLPTRKSHEQDNVPWKIFNTNKESTYENPLSLLDELPDTEGSSIIQTEDEDSDYLSTTVDPADSYTHQKLKGTGILLSTSEELYFLPYSWTTINPYEMKILEVWVEELLLSTSLIKNILGFFIWVTMQTSRSLRLVLDIPINQTIQREWSLNVQNFTFQRHPPYRNSGKQKQEGEKYEKRNWLTDEAKSWVIPEAEHIHFKMSEIIVQVINENKQLVENSATLGKLWDQLSEDSPEITFRELLPKKLKRVTPGMLISYQTQCTSSANQDGSFSRLLASHENSGLPGSCAYCSWDKSVVNQTLKDNKTNYLKSYAQIIKNPEIGMGSRLQILEPLLIKEIKHATKRLIKIRETGHLIEYHNFLTSYIVTALWAASGSRPIKDPFEDPNFFDFEYKFVYIEDKVLNQFSKGRIVPLPETLINYIKNEYLEHLKQLSKAIAPINKSLSDNISELSKGKTCEKMPFFFMLSEELEWQSISEKEIKLLGLFQWPLPFNLFRHRLTNQLRYHGVHSEIIDGICGHAESNGFSYGNFSTRCWEEDIKNINQDISSIFDSLNFNFPSLREDYSTIKISTNKENLHTSTKHICSFGRKKREQSRRRSKLQIRRQAQIQIDEFKGEKELFDLTSDEIDSLSKSLLYKKKGGASKNGYFKYQYFLRQIEKIWRQQGKKVVIKKRYNRLIEENTPFSEWAIGSQNLHQSVKKNLLSALSKLQFSRIHKNHCLIYGVLQLSIENQITDLKLLKKVLSNKNYRIISYYKLFYFEYAENLDRDESFAPVQRYKISALTAALFNQVQGEKTAYALNNHCLPEPIQNSFDTILSQFSEYQSDTIDALLKSLVKVIEQVNIITLPAVIAAYLSGKVKSTSLGWHDFIRLHTGNCVYIPKRLNESKDESLEGMDASKKILSLNIAQNYPAFKKILDKETCQKNTREFYSDLRNTITDDNKKILSKLTFKERRNKVRLIEDIISNWNDKISSASYLLGKWFASLLFQLKKTNKIDDYLSPSTISRYFSALSPAFESVSYAADLINFDEEDITEHYNEILEARKLKDKAYVGRRLIEFHLFSRKMEIREPDWSEIPIAETQKLVSPGIFTENEYKQVLDLLWTHKQISKEEQLACSFLLLGSFRFCIRGGEIINLSQADCIIEEEQMIFLVRPSKKITLKSRASRRQLPILFKLSDKEKEIINKQIDHSISLYGKTPKAPLFSPTIINKFNQLKAIIIEYLKLITGNPKIVFHHGRHSGIQIIANNLWDIPLPEHWNNIIQDDGDLNKQIKNTLLTTEHNTRRRAKALSVYSGHEHSKTEFSSYLHQIGDWTDMLIQVPKTSKKFIKKHIIAIDKFKKHKKINIRSLSHLTASEPQTTPVKLLMLMRTIAYGKTITNAANALMINKKDTENLEDLLNKIDNKILLSKTSKQNKNDKDRPYKLVHRINESAWNRMIKKTLLIESSIVHHSLSHDHIMDIFGKSKQILFWKDNQFKFIHDFINFFDIDENILKMVYSNTANQYIFDLAEKYSFYVISTTDAASGKYPIQIDIINDSENHDQRVDKLCALIIQKNEQFWIRNSLELIILFLAYFVSGKETPSLKN